MPEISTDTRDLKARLRQTLRRRRLALSQAQQLTAAHKLASKVTALPQWASARHIALYLAADGEIDTSPLANLARGSGKELYLPVILADNSLDFATWRQDYILAPNRYGINEPPAKAERRSPGDLDILFLPLVGWDRHGRRLGMGGGFYDRTLSRGSNPLLVGLAHTTQEVGNIPWDSWDIPLDFIATDATLFKCQGANQAAGN